jgi:hypothetical protein
MASLDYKKELILRYEEKFADSVAVSVIDKPKLSTWMILIPILFIYYFYRLKKFADGRKEFARHFILTRKRSLEEAAASLESGGKPDVEALVNMSSAPGSTHADYREWLKVLLDHYQYLLRSEGDSFETLIRSAYKTRTNYLLFINHLNRVERQFNTALKPSLKETTEEVNNIVTAIEQRCEDLRRRDAENFFP